MAVDAPAGPLLCALTLPGGATVADALAQARAQLGDGVADWAAAPVGIWGTQVGRGAAVRDGARIELYRPLPLDPRQRRRQRLGRR